MYCMFLFQLFLNELFALIYSRNNKQQHGTSKRTEIEGKRFVFQFQC